MGTKIAIIGFGFVGKATCHAFSKNNDIYILDVDIGSVSGLIDFKPEYTFICLPTPSENCDTSIIESYIENINKIDNTIVIMKSTVLPNKLVSIKNKLVHPLVYCPEFLREASYEYDAINPEMIVLGGDRDITNKVLLFMVVFSKMNIPNKIYHTTLENAALVKYTINSFLALKVTFFNQLYDAIGDNFQDVSHIVTSDDRVGRSHSTVPGEHGRGFAGKCLPKDVGSFNNYANIELLQHILDYNEKIRN